MKTVFISGNFSIVHPGHVRLFQLAKQFGDRLVVGVHSDETIISSIKVPVDLRLQSLNSIEMVDETVVVNNDLETILLRLKPDFVLKGSEHEAKVNDELEVIKTYGGKLIFGSGDFCISTDSFFDSLKNASGIQIDFNSDYTKRYGISKKRMLEVLMKCKERKLLVIGDLIIDEYINCESVGLSQEDPSVVFRPVTRKKFVGGAGIVALHAASIGAETHYIGLAGNDVDMEFALNEFRHNDVKASLLTDSARSTILKQRFRAQGKTQFRLNRFDDAVISSNLKSDISKIAEAKLHDVDVVIFSDFNYGFLTADIVNEIRNQARKRDVFISADCQISSQIADYSKYKNLDLVTPTEHEVRVTLRNNYDGLAAIAIAFQELIHSRNLCVTLGAEGVLVQVSQSSDLTPYATDLIPALNLNPVDVAGGGDSFLIVASLALASGASLHEASFLGSIAASIQVSRVGNTPLTINELAEAINN
jgi:rfaE bifunctional protein kinase chain/domain